MAYLFDKAFALTQVQQLQLLTNAPAKKMPVPYSLRAGCETERGHVDASSFRFS